MDASLLAVALAAAQSVAVPPVPPAAPALHELIVPRGVMTPPGASMTGLLFETKVDGVCALDHNASPYEPGADCPYGQYVFARDGESLFVPYFLSTGAGQNFMAGWEIFPGFVGDFAMFDSSTPNGLGLSKDVHLLEVEVNGKRGGQPHEIHFAITNAAPLRYTLDVDAILKAFLKPYADEASSDVKALNAKLEAAVVALQAKEADYSQDTKDMNRNVRFVHGFGATWLNASKELRLSYYRRLEDVFSRQDQVGHGPRGRMVNRVHEYGSEYAIEAVYAKDGSLVSRTERPVAGFTTRRDH